MGEGSCDNAIREKLILDNMKLVTSIVSKYYSKHCERDDFLQIGAIGLIKAVDTFDAGKGVKLSTYAYTLIEREILMHLRKVKKIPYELSISEKTANIYDEAFEDDHDDIALATYDDIQDSIELAEEHVEMRALVDGLRIERDREIIKLKYGLNGGKPLTQLEIANIIGNDRSRIARCEKRALEELRDKLKGSESQWK